MSQILTSSIIEDLLTLKSRLSSVCQNWFHQVIWIQLGVLVGGGTQEIHEVGPCALLDTAARAEETIKDIYAMTDIGIIEKIKLFFQSYNKSATPNDRQLIKASGLAMLLVYMMYYNLILFMFTVVLGYCSVKTGLSIKILSPIAPIILLFWNPVGSFIGTIISIILIYVAYQTGMEIAEKCPTLESRLGPISIQINGQSRPRTWL